MVRSMKRKVAGILLVVLALSLQVTAYATDLEQQVSEDPNKIVIEVDYIEDNVEDIEIEDPNKVVVEVGYIEDTEVSVEYYLQRLVEAINKRDSFIINIVNPDNPIEYLKEMGVIDGTENLSQPLTRKEMAVLAYRALRDISKYEVSKTYQDVFTDIADCTKEEKQAIYEMWVLGISYGIGDNQFSPNSFVTHEQLEVIMEKLAISKHPQNRNLESVFPGYSNQETLTWGKLISLYGSSQEITSYVNTDGGSLDSNVTIERFLTAYTHLDPKSMITNSANGFMYVDHDTMFLSYEEWQALSLNLDKYITVDLAQLILDRTNEYKATLKSIYIPDNYEDLVTYTTNFIPTLKELVESNEEAVNFYLNTTSSNGDFTITVHNTSDLSDTLHELQHEQGARLAGVFKSRQKQKDQWVVKLSKNPDTQYLLDITNGEWVSTDVIKGMPKTEKALKNNDIATQSTQYSQYIRQDAMAANEYGIYGLANEFVSYAISVEVEALNSEIHYNGSTFNTLQNRAQDFIFMRNSIMDYVDYLKQNDAEKYNKLMEDTEFIRYLNRVASFAEQQFVYTEYYYYQSYNLQKLNNWCDTVFQRRVAEAA